MDIYPMLNFAQLEEFKRQGYLVLPQFTTPELCDRLLSFAQSELDGIVQPIEYEADTRYPGAPASRDAEGGQTARRLLQAYSRAELIAEWATQKDLADNLKQLLGQNVRMSQVHHNCIMTKQARFSSLTGWHRDSRYWHFQRPELISVWLALRDEKVENGCLLVLPGSHRWQIESAQLDSAQFLRADHVTNQSLLETAVTVPLKQGDVLLFSSNLFHAAGCNQTTQTKFSMVFTYRALDNEPIPHSRSASKPEIVI
ncbi:phytanoyl-CoA dioxygenase family protein [Undibacterium fentianense]|uniref:Phytanoyl-CoA dioxygenase family protein n=1 Tax=Undibacterium fentianense TaxID=2828728 RepID=A0A941E1P4_9BURK|nr:phytanoyl-CoA dioxygenase family protein [Undibacterium fentianense]MBR7799761.1 phytanoyl-CoA dioxygenase family protein [Undibacterium fentianense]